MERASIVLREFVGPDLRAVKHAQDANGIVVDQVGCDIGRARQARACQRCARAGRSQESLAGAAQRRRSVRRHERRHGGFRLRKNGDTPRVASDDLHDLGGRRPPYAMSVRIIAN